MYRLLRTKLLVMFLHQNGWKRKNKSPKRYYQVFITCHCSIFLPVAIKLSFTKVRQGKSTSPSRWAGARDTRAWYSASCSYLAQLEGSNIIAFNWYIIDIPPKWGSKQTVIYNLYDTKFWRIKHKKINELADFLPTFGPVFFLRSLFCTWWFTLFFAQWLFFAQF